MAVERALYEVLGISDDAGATAGAEPRLARNNAKGSS